MVKVLHSTPAWASSSLLTLGRGRVRGRVRVSVRVNSRVSVRRVEDAAQLVAGAERRQGELGRRRYLLEMR